MTQKTREPEKGARARRASSRALPRGPQAELYLESADGNAFDRDAALRWLREPDAGVRQVGRDGDEWLDETGRIRVLLGEDRVLFRFQLADESQEQLARHLDRLFDLAFDLGRELSLEVVDPQLGSSPTRFRYESQFPHILDVYHRKARTAFALLREDAWSEVSSEGVALALPASAPAFDADPESLPPAVWSRRVKRVGPLEFHGDRSLAALADVTPDKPWFAITARGARDGDEVALLRVLRISRPAADVAIVEAVSAGLTVTATVSRDRVTFG